MVLLFLDLHGGRWPIAQTDPRPTPVPLLLYPTTKSFLLPPTSALQHVLILAASTTRQCYALKYVLPLANNAHLDAIHRDPVIISYHAKAGGGVRQDTRKIQRPSAPQ